LQLPCNVSVIESVHIPIEDAKVTGPNFNGFDAGGAFTERYVEHFK
jgi:hypothetical protein